MWCAAFATILTVAFAADCRPAASKLELFGNPNVVINGTDTCSGTCTLVTSVQAGQGSRTYYVKMGVISQVLTLQAHSDNDCADPVKATYTPTSTGESDKIKAGNLGMVDWEMPNDPTTEQFNIKVTGGCYPTLCTATTTATTETPATTSTAAGSVQSALALAFALLGVTCSM